MPESHGEVIITLRDIYEQQIADGKELSKIRSTLDLMGNTMAALALSNQHLAEVDNTLVKMQAHGAGEDHDRRISSLERWRAGVVAVGAVAGTSAGVLAAAIITKVL